MYRSPILPVQPPAPYLSSSGQLGAARVGQEPGPYWVPTSGPGGPPNLMEETDNDNLVSTVLIEVALGRGAGVGTRYSHRRTLNLLGSPGKASWERGISELCTEASADR